MAADKKRKPTTQKLCTCFQLTRVYTLFIQVESMWFSSLAQREIEWCLCVFTSESCWGCAWLSVTVAINSDDSELVADSWPQALQRHCDRAAGGGEESDEGVPHSFIWEGEGERGRIYYTLMDKADKGVGWGGSIWKLFSFKCQNEIKENYKLSNCI